MDVARIFLADALEIALGAGALGLRLDAGVFRLEGRRDRGDELEVLRTVPDDRSLFLRRRDEFRCDRRRLDGCCRNRPEQQRERDKERDHWPHPHCAFSYHRIGAVPQRLASRPPSAIAMTMTISSGRGASATDTVTVSKCSNDQESSL